MRVELRAGNGLYGLWTDPDLEGERLALWVPVGHTLVSGDGAVLPPSGHREGMLRHWLFLSASEGLRRYQIRIGGGVGHPVVSDLTLFLEEGRAVLRVEGLGGRLPVMVYLREVPTEGGREVMGPARFERDEVL
jgi:hypothetical protein